MKTPIMSLNDGDIEYKTELLNDGENGDEPVWFFDHAKATAVLLMNDVLKLTSGYALGETSLVFIFDDVRMKGVPERIYLQPTDIELLYKFWQHDPEWGAVYWVCDRVLGFIPQPEIRAKMESNGWAFKDRIAMSNQDWLDQFRSKTDITEN